MVPNAFEFDEWDLLWCDFEEAKRQAQRKPDLIRELLAELEILLEEGRRFDIESYFADRVELARHNLDQARKELENRIQLHRAFATEIGTQIGYCQVSLQKFAGWGVGYNTGVDVKRNHLERQLQQLRAERRATELRAWDDIVRLRKDLREARLEYRGAERLTSSLSGSDTKQTDARHGRTDQRGCAR